MFGCETYLHSTIVGAALSLRRRLEAYGVLAGFVIAVCTGARAVELPPDVPATTLAKAPEAIIPAGPGLGSNVYKGSYAFAGSYIVEISTYDAAAAKPATSFKIRSAATHGVKYALKSGESFKGKADAQVFADGDLLALKLRDTPNGQVRVSIHKLSTGELLFTLRQPDPKADDYFGGNVWFTSDRILVAASGRDHSQTNEGGLYVYNRTNGRFVRFAGSGVKNAYFGTPPSDQYLPYVQSSGPAALFVHGNRMFRFLADQLQPLAIPPEGKNKAWPNGALITGNYVVVRTGEQNADGYGTKGRVIVYNLAKRTVLYQLRASGLKGGYDFPSGIAVSGDRLFVHDSTATYPDSASRGAIGAYALASGKLISVRSFPKVTGVYQDGRSLALSGGLLWVRTYAEGGVSSWLGCDPVTLKQVRTLRPPGTDRFVGSVGAPRHLSGNRFGVIALRTEISPVWWSSVPSPVMPELPSALSSAVTDVSSVVIISPGDSSTHTTAGVLIYDMASAAWTHRLRLEAEAAESYSPYFLNEYKPLRIASGSGSAAFRVSLADSATQILGFDTVLPNPAPTVTLESRLTLYPQPGYSYEIMRRPSGAADFSPFRRVSFGDGYTHTEILPYADYRDAVQFRLDGTQFSRRLSTPGAAPIALDRWIPVKLAASRGATLALRIPGPYNSSTQSYGSGSVRLIDTTTGGGVGTVYPSMGTGLGPVAFNEAYIAVGSPKTNGGDIEIFDATTGNLLRTLSGSQAFGSHLVLSGDLLATSAVSSAYLGGTYTHTSHILVYELTTGALLHMIPLATATSTSSWSGLPVSLAGAGNKVAGRGFTSGGSFADTGNVQVFDLTTGEAVFTVVSPAPAAGDYFGAWLAAGGDALAVGASGSGEVSVFDLTTGELRHTLAIMERPSAAQVANSVISIDEAGDYLSWFVDGDFEANPFLMQGKAAYIFDLETGLEEAKILHPYVMDVYGGGYIDQVLFTNHGIVALTSQAKVLDYALSGALATPLVETSIMLEPIPVVRLRFPTRKGVSYQPEYSANNGVTWKTLNVLERYYGDGKAADMRISLEGLASPSTLRFRLKTRWGVASEPIITAPPMN